MPDRREAGARARGSETSRVGVDDTQRRQEEKRQEPFLQESPLTERARIGAGDFYVPVNPLDR